MASAADKLKRTSNGGIPAIATVQASRTAGVTTLSVDTQQFWPDNTMTGVAFSTYKVDTNNKRVAGSQIDWSGVSNGINVISDMVRVGGATDTGNVIGDKVQMGPTAKWAEDVIEGFGNQHSLVDGTHGNITATGYSQASGTFAVPNGVISAAALHLPVNFKAYRNAAWSTTSILSHVPFDTDEWDTGSNFSTGTGKITIPFNGYYAFGSKISIVAGGSAITPSVCFQLVPISAPGSPIQYFGPQVNIGAGGSSIVGNTEFFFAHANDTVEVLILATSGLAVIPGEPNVNFSARLVSVS